MEKYKYIKLCWAIGIYIPFFIIIIYGTYKISPLIHANQELEKIKQETGKYPMEIVNPVTLQDLNAIAKDFNGTIIFSGNGKIIVKW